MTLAGSTHRAARRDGRLLGLVLAAALAVVALEYDRFLAQPLARWEGLAHDRNHHYVLAQRLAVDLAGADLVAWLRDAERFRMWPPLHGLLASVPLALTDIDFRAAVAPSLLGFGLAIVFGFLAARRASPDFGNAAGLVTAAFIAASPAHHRYAADVMLESLGAGLTLACLYFFLGLLEETRAEARARSGRLLGLCLTLLLLEKYNYYLLTAASLALTSLALASGDRRVRTRLVARARALVGSGQVGDRLRREVLHPLNWLALCLACLAAAVVLSGGWSGELFGRHISMTRPFSLIHLAYLSICLRVAPWWWRKGRIQLRRTAPPIRNLVLWHAIPLALWFALPRRLGYFLHHVSPANSPADSDSLLTRAGFYARAFGADYHAHADAPAQAADPSGLWGRLLAAGIPEWALGACLAVALALVVLVRLRSLGPRARAALGFAAVSLCLTLLHPYSLSRFLHSWLASVWVVSGIGAAAALVVLRPRPGGRAIAAAMACLVALYASRAASSWQRPAPLRSERSIAGLLDLDLLGSPTRRSPDTGIALVSNTPAKPLLEWMLVERGLDRRQLEIYTPKRSHVPGSRDRFLDWLASTPGDTLLFLEVSRASPWYAANFPTYEELSEFLREQQMFRPSETSLSPAPGARMTRFERVAR